jgi:hypothetical protein
LAGQVQLLLHWFLITLSTVLMKMMTNQHPITPPLELVHQWADMLASRSDQAVFTMAAQWGADQELEACCEWLHDTCVEDPEDIVPELRAARRPNPPSLKELALEALAAIEGDFNTVGDRANTIRRALEALDD